MPRTGDGYLTGSFKIAAMSSADVASTTTCGCETKSPNQLVRSDMDSSCLFRCAAWRAVEYFIPSLPGSDLLWVLEPVRSPR
jgi:hypothetical protein